MPTRKTIRGLVLPVCILVIVGCGGGGLVPVTGKVTHKGEPAKGAVVVFHPKNATIQSQFPSGVADDNGTFQLMTGPDTGAPPGDYVVTIVWPEQPKTEKKKKISTAPSETEAPDRLKGKYASATSSKLTATVSAGSTNLSPFEVE